VARLEVTRDLPVALREGFDYITNVENWSEYWPKLLEIPERESVRWREPGDRAAVVIDVRGRPTELQMTLEQFVPYDRVVYRSSQEGLPEFHHERLFRDDGGRLRYTLVIAYEPRPGLKGVFDRLVLPRYVRASLVETMDNLERVLAS
jgi:Polyketide cyclase / dehydrase and lipid transport